MTTLRELELEYENNQLRMKIHELSAKLGIFETRFVTKPAEELTITGELPPTLHKYVTMESRITPHGGLEVKVIGHKKADKETYSEPFFWQGYYIQLMDYPLSDLPYQMDQLHTNFQQGLLHHIRKNPALFGHK